MYIIDTKKYVVALFCISAIGYSIASPVLDPALDPNRTAVLVEKEVRLLEKDLNGNGQYIPEDDIILLRVVVRESLNTLPWNDLYSNPSLVRATANNALVQFVEKRTRQHASAVTTNSRIINNAAKTESIEFMGLLQKNPLRPGDKLYHHFGRHSENRVQQNVMTGIKYSY